MAWDLGLELTGYRSPAELSADRTRVEYRWDESVTEWYENRPEGVKHGLTLAAPPPGSDGAQVELVFALRGDLQPTLDDQGQTLRLLDGDERIGSAVRTRELGDLFSQEPLPAEADGDNGKRQAAAEEILSLASSLRWEVGPGFHESLVETIYTEAARIADHTVSRSPQRAAALFFYSTI